MRVIESYITEDLYPIKSPYTMVPQFVVIHNTANNASAVNEIAYMKRNANKVSYHYAADDIGVYAVIPENRNAWHAGDGSNGNGNRNGISIEICYSLDGGERFAKGEEYAAELVADILARYGWGIDRVKKHDDFAATSCPHRTKELGWDRFLHMVEKYLVPAPTETVETLYAMQVILADRAEAEVLSSELESRGYLPTLSEIGVKRVEKVTEEELPKEDTFAPYNVMVNTSQGVNIREGAGTNYRKVGAIKNKAVVTIVEESVDDTDMIWGKLSDGGWISLAYCVKV